MTNYTPHLIPLPPGIQALEGAKGQSIVCPSCHCTASLWAVKLTKSFVKPLGYMVRTGEMLDKNKTLMLFGTSAWTTINKLKHWGFIQKIDDVVMPTQLGRMFINGEIAVPDELYVYQDRARTGPNIPLGDFVSVDSLISYEEMDREIAASRAIPLQNI